jgi:hypothetical protein
MKEKTKTDTLVLKHIKLNKQNLEIINIKKLRKCKTLSNHDIKGMLNDFKDLNKVDLNTLKKSKSKDLGIYFSNRYKIIN